MPVVVDRLSGIGEDADGGVRYLHALREHWLLIAAIVVLAVGAAAAYSLTAEKRFEADAELLITPVASDDPTFLGFGLLREGDSQSRAVITAARLVTTPAVGEVVAQRLGGSRTALLDAVQVTPVSQANIVSVVGSASSAERAAAIANAFATAAIERQSSRFQTELTSTIERLRAQINAFPPERRNDPQAVAIAQRLGNLLGLTGTPDPTIRILSEAVPPQRAVWPRPVLSIGVALIASLLLAVGLALALSLVNPRINREDELLLDQRLPILTRVPRMKRSVIRGYLTGREPLPGNVREAYRTLRATVMAGAREGAGPRIVLVTSASPGEGKTMTSVNLAMSLATGGQRVILVDGDLRRPMVATVFNASAPIGVAQVLLEEASPEEALVPAPGHGPELRLLLASPEHAQLVDLLEPRRVGRLLEHLTLLADIVVVDSPPITEVADALALADDADVVLVAVRLGRTRRDRLTELRRMLSQRGIRPAGFVVTTKKPPRGGGYYYGSDGGGAQLESRPSAGQSAQPAPPAPAAASAERGIDEL